MEADDEALETIARRAGGSMRDAQSLLDQLLAFSGRSSRSMRFTQLLGTAHEETRHHHRRRRVGQDTKKVLEC